MYSGPGLRVLWLVCLMMVVPPLSAEVYKWVDENGLIHYSDSKPENQAFEQVEINAGSYTGVSYATLKDDVGKQVIMLSADWCGVCKKAKRYFRRNGIRFTELDIEKSTKGKRLYQKLGARGVPVILVGRERMNGFSEAGFERLYSKG